MSEFEKCSMILFGAGIMLIDSLSKLLNMYMNYLENVVTSNNQLQNLAQQFGQLFPLLFKSELSGKCGII